MLKRSEARGGDLQDGEWNREGKSNHVRVHVCAQSANRGGIIGTVSHHSPSTLPICLSSGGEAAATLCQWRANLLSPSVTLAVIGKYNKQIFNRETNCRSVCFVFFPKKWRANNNKCISTSLVIPVVVEHGFPARGGWQVFWFLPKIRLGLHAGALCSDRENIC